MVILISDLDDWPTRMALVDGFLPEKKTLESIKRIYNQVGFASQSGDTYATAFEYFEDISSLAIKLECEQNNINFGRNQNTIGEIHHYLLYHERARNPNTQRKCALSKDRLFGRLESLFPDASNPAYCINLLATPDDFTNDRLMKYIFSWLNTTRFIVTQESEYRDYSAFLKLCDKLFSRINAVYSHPFDVALQKEVNTERTFFRGFKLNS